MGSRAVKAYWRISASISIACLLVIAGKAETLAMLVKARAAVVEKRMVMVLILKESDERVVREDLDTWEVVL